MLNGEICIVHTWLKVGSFSHEVSLVWITNLYSLCSTLILTQYIPLSIYLFWKRRIKEDICKYNSIESTSQLWAERTQTPSLWDLASTARGRSLTEQHSLAVTDVCKLKMIYKKGMETMFSSSTFIICTSALLWIWSTALMRSHFNFVIKVMRFQSPVVYITVMTHNFFVILQVSNTVGIMNWPTAFSRYFTLVVSSPRQERFYMDKRSKAGEGPRGADVDDGIWGLLCP